MLACFAFQAASTREPNAAAEIRALRTQSNAAVAAHDFATMRTFFLPGYIILPGSSGMPFTIDSFGKRIGATFDDPTFVTYVRTPDRIMIGPSGKRAAEVGHWVGTWRKPDGEMRLSGIYQATWLPTLKGWRLINESFISLRCVGSKHCPEVD
jgi:ketosteroid isomerase-like protein